MLRRGLLPDRRAYTAAISRLRPAHALRLFDAVLHHLRRAPDSSSASFALPDTAAFNAALSACADAGDCRRFRQLFDEMRSWPGAAPDALTYNVAIKMCARAGRRDLVARVLERILSSGLAPCATTFHSLVAAYVGFGDIPTAERIVQAMRDGRSDVCLLLRHVAVEGNDEKGIAIVVDEHSDVLEDIVGPKPEEGTDAPLLSKTYPPNSRVYTTLMKGYMNAGRVDDVVTMARAMRREGETMPASRPDHVTYTTVVSTLAAAGDMERAHAVLDEMARAGVPASRVTYNVLIKGYCQQLQMSRARELLEEMTTEAGIEADVVTYNTLIDGCVLMDDSAGALALFNEMRTRGVAPSTPDEELLDALADVCVRGAFFKKALEIVACMEENGIAPNKTKYKKIYIEMHSRMFTSKHASQARQERRRERKRAAEAFKFWLGLPNSYYGSEWRIGPLVGGGDEDNDDDQLE
ncbi:unnamed protein product [Triticum turgidum subsp. durum]|uniref:Pentacotripeptide-repeat region of PRORP domain-containing protein n=1 Tax=Triticum turgidum subsp. durum TaxID=4567 RepID=A0A9R0WLR0_TRITD|nr:unnamed protein product [Triticum turgidum subsp. durum]